MKQIDWTKWSAIAEILAAIAIVATLLYLAIQTQQNSAQLRAQIVLAQAEYRRAFDDRLIQNPDLAALWLKAQRGDVLSEVEQVQVNRIVQAEFTARETEYGLLRYTDATDREAFLATLEELFDGGYGWMQPEGVREAWDFLKHLRNQDFVRFVESNVLEDSE